MLRPPIKPGGRTWVLGLSNITGMPIAAKNARGKIVIFGCAMNIFVWLDIGASSQKPQKNLKRARALTAIMQDGCWLERRQGR